MATTHINKENQTDLPGFSVFELFDQLAEYYQSKMDVRSELGPGWLLIDDDRESLPPQHR